MIQILDPGCWILAGTQADLMLFPEGEVETQALNGAHAS